jgi:hypothetical protein
MPNRNGNEMPRKRKRKPDAASGAVKRVQYNLGFMPPAAARINRTAELLGLDATQLLRMMIHEHLPEYEQRAAKAGGNSQ